jgi:hypothetical protein
VARQPAGAAGGRRQHQFRPAGSLLGACLEHGEHRVKGRGHTQADDDELEEDVGEGRLSATAVPIQDLLAQGAATNDLRHGGRHAAQRDAREGEASGPRQKRLAL